MSAKMKRREFITLLGGAAVAWPLGGRAQQGEQMRRIGVLMPATADDPEFQARVGAFLQALALSDWTIGANVRIDAHWAGADAANIRRHAAELVALAPDVILAYGASTVRPLLQATRTVPIVFPVVGDPVGAGVVSNLARPGGNVTGISSLQTELIAKRLEVLKTLAPAVRRVWLIYYQVDLGTTPMVTKALEAAQRMKIELSPKGLIDAADLKRVLNEVRPGDALLAPEGSNPDLTIAIIERSRALRVPAVFGTALWVGYGGLISYGPDYYAQGIQAAGLVAKILRGTRPQDLPVEGAEKIDLAVNLKTAELLGLTVPRKILLRADAFRR